VTKHRNIREQVYDERQKPGVSVTCPASRHLHMMAEHLWAGRPYPMLTEEPKHCAESMLYVLMNLWKARRRIHELEQQKHSNE
jgi:hypothetical protein